jgi:hypothetical protein
MNRPQLFRKTEERTFFAHHMLLHAAELSILDAESSEVGRFNKCLASMVMTSLAVEAIANAVGSRVETDWVSFERLKPHEKIDLVVRLLKINKSPSKEPWSTLTYLGGFRNDIAHPKPEDVVNERILPELALTKSSFDTPLSKFEREITLGNAKRCFAAVHALKGILSDALPDNQSFGIYADMWHSSTSAHES